MHKFVPSICGSSFLTILIFVTSFQITGASAADPSRDKLLDGCNTLDVCLQVLDRTPKDPDGALAPDASGIAAYLQRFGDPARTELLKRATGPDRAWENLAGSILMYWPTFSADDVPLLKEALQRDPGGWVAIPLGRIATSEAIQALANDVRLHGGESQSGEALRRLGIKAFPYLLAMLEDDARWKNVAQLLDQMRVDAAGSAPAWAAIATNQARPLRKRLAALRALEAIGSTARAQGPVLRPLLKDSDRSIRDAAADTLRDMGDESVVDGLVRSCKPTMSQGKPEPFTSSDFETRCVEKIAAFGATARTFAPILLSRFLSSKNGRDRALGAALLGYIGFQPAAPRLIELLDDTDWRVVFAAARSLGWLHAGIAIPSLTKIAQTHWLPEAKQEAANAIAALQPNAQPLAKPEVRQGHFHFPPNVQLEVDATAVPDIEPCKSGHWQFRNTTIAEPEESNMKVSISARGRLPAGELIGEDHGEFGGGLFWNTAGHKSKSLYQVNVAGVQKLGDGAVAAFGEVGEFAGYAENSPPLPAGQTNFWISNGPSGYGFVLSVTRDLRGQWQLAEIARLPRAAETIDTISPDLFAAWVGGRVVVFSSHGIQGLAACVNEP